MEDWDFKNLYTYYDEFFQLFHISGEIVNNTNSYQRITSLIPVVYDENGDRVTTEDDVDFLPGYDTLLDTTSLSPGRSLPFGFLVYLPEDAKVENNYEILIDATPSETTRDDLSISFDDFDAQDWPDHFIVEGTLDNPGPDLTEYLAIVVVLYDQNEHVIGIGWSFYTSASELETGKHDFEIEIEPFEIVYEQDLAVDMYRIKLFGY